MSIQPAWVLPICLGPHLHTSQTADGISQQCNHIQLGCSNAPCNTNPSFDSSRFLFLGQWDWFFLGLWAFYHICLRVSCIFLQITKWGILCLLLFRLNAARPGFLSSCVAHYWLYICPYLSSLKPFLYFQICIVALTRDHIICPSRRLSYSPVCGVQSSLGFHVLNFTYNLISFPSACLCPCPPSLPLTPPWPWPVQPSGVHRAAPELLPRFFSLVLRFL